MAETFANNAVGTLNAAITTTGATSFVLQAGQGAAFPATGNFRVLIDSELMLVGARSGDTCSSVTRGIEGTAAATHLINAAVTHELTAGALAQFIQPNYATTLPGSPTDGQVAILVDSVTLPTYQWMFRWNAGSSNTDKWEFAGGTKAYAEITASESTASTTYVALTTAGPSFALPRAGVYLVEIGVYAAGSVVAIVAMSYDIGATGAVDTDSVQANNTASTSAARTRLKTGLTAVTLTAKYRVSTGTGTFANRWIAVTPVRVS